MKLWSWWWYEISIDFQRFLWISDRYLYYTFHGMSWYFFGSYFLAIRKAGFLVTSPDSPRALDWEHNDMTELPKIKNHVWNLVLGLRTGENYHDFLLIMLEKDPLYIIWNQIKAETSGSGILLKPSNLFQPWIFTEESGSSVASSASQGRISISNRFKQKILQTCCAWTWEEVFDINNSGLIDFIPLLWDV